MSTPTSRIAFLFATALAGLLFLAAAALQVNDPDPARWIAYYGLAAAVSFAAMRRVPAWVPGTIAVLSVVWLGVMASLGLPEEPHPMKYGPQTGWLADEVVREGMGIAIVLVWMVVLAVRAVREARRPPPSADIARNRR